VRYTGEGDAAADGDALSVERLSRLPADVRRVLHRTLSKGDDESALDVVRRVGEMDATLAVEIERKLREFEIEDLLRLLELAER
jgi:hypothetical protein